MHDAGHKQTEIVGRLTGCRREGLGRACHGNFASRPNVFPLVLEIPKIPLDNLLDIQYDKTSNNEIRQGTAAISMRGVGGAGSRAEHENPYQHKTAHGVCLLRCDPKEMRPWKRFQPIENSRP
jgi:hypothetical protein